jgi:hypothetical protein
MTCLNLHDCMYRCAKASYLDKIACNATGPRRLQHLTGRFVGKPDMQLTELHPDPLQSPIHAPTSADQNNHVYISWQAMYCSCVVDTSHLTSPSPCGR